MLKRKLKKWSLKTKLITLTICLASFSFSQTVQADSTIVFTQEEFDNLLVKMNSCILERDNLYLTVESQDSLIAVQDSMISKYEYKDGLVKPFYQQEWFRSILFTVLGAVIQNEVKESLNE